MDQWSKAPRDSSVATCPTLQEGKGNMVHVCGRGFKPTREKKFLVSFTNKYFNIQYFSHHILFCLTFRKHDCFTCHDKNSTKICFVSAQDCTGDLARVKRT